MILGITIIKKEIDFSTAMALMRTYYNRYLFAIEATEAIYNPTLTLYFLKFLQGKAKFPREMLDTNLSIDEGKLQYVADIRGGKDLFIRLFKQNYEVVIQKLSARFGLKTMLSDQSKDRRFLASFLYYSGVLTLNGETEKGELRLQVPNLVMRQLYLERIQEMLLPDPVDRDEGIFAATELYKNGNMTPLAKFLENHYFMVFRNPDYKWANELTIKTLFLSLLYNDTLYIMDSEPEIDRRFPDLTMILRPDMRRFKVFDVLIEFKYVKLGQINMSAEHTRKASVEALQHVPLMQRNMDEAKKQARDYGDSLQRRYHDLNLTRFAVVALGFERLWWEEVQ